MDTNFKDSMDEKSNPYLQLDQDEEAEETLSLCDLPIYSGGAIDDQSFSSLSSSSDQDFFEFFSEDWSNSSTNFPVQNIVFCGKLISYREPISISDTNKHNLGSNKQRKKAQNRGFFRWNLRFFNRKGRFASKSNRTNSRRGGSGSKYGFSVRRASILASPAKPRWQLLMFGLARFPAAEMEMRDIKNRQRRRSPSELFRLSGSGGGGGEKVRRVEGLWGLIRSLGCGGGHRANAVVEA